MNDVEDQILANQIAIMRMLKTNAPAVFFAGMHDYQQELSDRIKETEDLIQCHEEPA